MSPLLYAPWQWLSRGGARRGLEIAVRSGLDELAGYDASSRPVLALPLFRKHLRSYSSVVQSNEQQHPTDYTDSTTWNLDLRCPHS